MSPRRSKGVKPRRRAELRGKIERLIESSNLPGGRLPGYRDLARDFGASGQTVQSVLAEMESCGLLERRHGVGTFVTDRDSVSDRRATRQLAIITPSHFEERPGWDYQGEMIRGALGQAPRLRASCETLALDRPDEKARVFSAREMRRFDGFVAVSLSDPEVLARLLALRRGPVVVIDRVVRSLPVTAVLDDSFGGARALTRHVLGLGHRRIAFIDHFDRENRNSDRYDGYRAALAEKNIDLDEDLVAAPLASDRGIADKLGALDEFAASALERFLNLESPPTAILGFNDYRALAMLRAIEDRGLRVGRDISLAGFNDAAVRRGLYPELTSCRIYPRKSGAEAVRAALESKESGVGRTIVVPTRLFRRKSTAPPPGA